jgi:hypothetical protein
MAVSRDGGETFDNFKVSESPFNPDPGIFFGDYTNVSACNNIVRPIWTRLDNGALSVVTAIVDSLYVGITPEKISPVPFSLDQNYPNPSTGTTSFSFKIHQPSRVSLRIFDLFGNEVACLLNNKPMDKGKYIERFDTRSRGLAPGFYYFSLVNTEQSIIRKMVVE